MSMDHHREVPGGEPVSPDSYINPYRDTALAVRARRRISGWAIAGMVLSTVVWVISAPVLFRFVEDNLRYGVSYPVSVFDLVFLLGVTALLTAVIGFGVAFALGRRRLAARIYNFSALAWVVTFIAMILWLIALFEMSG